MPDIDMASDLRRSLFSHYCKALCPAVLLFAFWALMGGRFELAPPLPLNIFGPAVFIGAITFAVALPLFFRTRFVGRVSAEKSVSRDDFLKFEKQLISVAVIGAYFAAAGYVFEIGRFHFTGAFLAALYGAYYYFPGSKRVVYEMKMFRVGDGG